MIANTQGVLMKTKLDRPWLTASQVEIPLAELKEISKTWDEQIWNDYLNWFQSGCSEKLISISGKASILITALSVTTISDS